MHKTFGILMAAGFLLSTVATQAQEDRVWTSVGAKAWMASWENTPQGIDAKDDILFGFSGLVKYKKVDLSLSYLDGDFDLGGEGLDGSREEVRLSLGYSLTDRFNVFVGLSDLSGEVDETRPEFVTQVVGVTNGVPIVEGTTRERVGSRNYELQGFHLGGAFNAPFGDSDFYGYATASFQPLTQVSVANMDLDDGFGFNIEAGVGYIHNYISAKLGYRLERMDNGNDFEEELGGFVLVAGVAF